MDKDTMIILNENDKSKRFFRIERMLKRLSNYENNYIVLTLECGREEINLGE